jgi:integrase
MLRLAKVTHRAEEAGLPPSTPLVALEREHARKVRDLMLKTEKKGGGGLVAPASVKRDIALIKAVISHGILELGLSGKAHNPFEKLDIQGTETVEARIADRDKVDPLPPKVVAAMGSKLTGELRLIWRLLEGTGCRLAEVTGLRVSDVVVLSSGATPPHIKIRWHDVRRLKNLSSVRSVPLVGDALGAAQEALKLADGEAFLFPRYARVRGPDAASAVLMKHLRGFTKDKRHKVHSLRHGMKDRMRKAGVDKIAQDVVLGHAASNIGELYGGSEGLLAVALRALEAVEVAEASSSS